MKYFCRECGQEIPGSEDFCYNCGALKKTAIAIDDSGSVVSEKEGACPYCGFENSAGEAHCASCGKPVAGGAMSAQVAFQRKLTGREKLAIGLSVVPGVLGVFGLGHVVMRRYSRALLYLAISVIWLYIYIFYVRSGGSSFFLWMLFEFFLFFRQCMEVIGLVYFKGPGNERGP